MARRAAKEQKQEQAQEPTSADRLEDFASAVAHELKEPLRTISMFTELLVNAAHMDAHGQQLGHFIIDGVSRIAALLDGIQAFAIHGSDDLPRPVDLKRVVADVLQNLAAAIAASAANVAVGPLPCVLGNEKHLVRIFQNLIVNAIKYRSGAPVEIRVTAERLGPEWIVKVTDNGVGIAREYHEQVFGLFNRLPGREIPGAGIGLAISKKLVEESGGTIWVESELGTGSTFCFTIAAIDRERQGLAILEHN